MQTRKDRKWRRTRNPRLQWNPPKLSGPPLGQVANQNVGGQEIPQTGPIETSVAAHAPPHTETAGGELPNDGDNGIILQIWGRLGDHDHAFIQTGDRITAVEQSVESVKNDARCIWKKTHTLQDDQKRITRKMEMEKKTWIRCSWKMSEPHTHTAKGSQKYRMKF